MPYEENPDWQNFGITNGDWEWQYDSYTTPGYNYWTSYNNQYEFSIMPYYSTSQTDDIFYGYSDVDGDVAKSFDCLGWFGVKRGVFLVDKDLDLKYSHVESVSIFKRTAKELVDAVKKHS